MQPVSKTGTIQNGAKILEERFASEWSRIQSALFSFHRKKANTIETVEKYEQVTIALQNRKIDLAVLPIPMNLFAEYYGYKTIDLPATISTRYGDLTMADGCLLASREFVESNPEVARTIIYECEDFYHSFLSKKFEHFLGFEQSEVLNDYCARKMGLSRKKVQSLVENKKHDIKITN